jgi:Domain of unknown function (DUF4111)
MMEKEIIAGYPADMLPDSVLPVVTKLRDALLDTLGADLIGLYLTGSLAVGDFNDESDIDFVAITCAEIDPQVDALNTMHARIIDSRLAWSSDVEGSYLSLEKLRNPDPAQPAYWFLDRGTATLEFFDHDRDGGALLRWVLHKHGIALYGPDPATLLDPVSDAQLRQAMRTLIVFWVDYEIHKAQTGTQTHWRRMFNVLGMCRVLYTHRHAQVVSKRAAATWFCAQPEAQTWRDLIDPALASTGRAHWQNPLTEAESLRLLAFMRYIEALVVG